MLTGVAIGVLLTAAAGVLRGHQCHVPWRQSGAITAADAAAGEQQPGHDDVVHEAQPAQTRPHLLQIPNVAVRLLRAKYRAEFYAELRTCKSSMSSLLTTRLEKQSIWPGA